MPIRNYDDGLKNYSPRRLAKLLVLTSMRDCNIQTMVEALFDVRLTGLHKAKCMVLLGPS